MYLGLLLLYSGIGLLAGNWWTFILIPLLIIVINNLVIKREENYLERTFGQSYLDYKKKTRRWV
jgi:protein-S-isoprenylcysteine O-methyltransferase Ste14